MSSLLHHPKLAVYDGKSFDLNQAKTDLILDNFTKKKAEKVLLELQEEMSILQQKMYATDNHSLLLVFQAMDAAGKDSTIKNVFNGMFPQACQVFSFKAPSKKELEHDFLWRTTRCLPERGRVSIFNRSYYEEVLVTRVHPSFILGQRIPGIDTEADIDEAFWKSRMESIKNYESHLAKNGTVILKFFLNVSKEEQKNRFLDRINVQGKNWKFNVGDLKERGRWDDYQHAYTETIKHTSADHAPWFVIPADRKWYMRYCVSKIIVERLRELNLSYPELPQDELTRLAEAKRMLESE
jgi:PPK2 family polyphosphate:nucleotide phosphotransferase